MIKITLICLGKLKEKYLKEAVSEYLKRLSRYCSFDVVELEPIRLPEKPSQSEIDIALSKEADMIIKKLPQNCDVFTLCVEGKEFSSEKFAREIELSQNSGKNLAFIIGSSYGLSDKVKNISKVKLSFSQMTFPHQLFRVMLLEQIYRAFKINEGSTYHK